MTSPAPVERPTLRRATPADAETLAALHTASRATAYRGLLPDDYLDRVLPAECLVEWRRKLLAQADDGAGQTLVAEVAATAATTDGTDEREAIGFACMSEPDDQGSVYLDNLHARPDRKGVGLGTAMLTAATRWARERGARRMHLLVLEGNVAAIGFYEARGWHRAGRNDNDEMGGHRISSLVYALELEPRSGD